MSLSKHTVTKNSEPWRKKRKMGASLVPCGTSIDTVCRQHPVLTLTWLKLGVSELYFI